MADIETRHDTPNTADEDYTTGELIFWIVGILMIPMVPILMSYFLTPWSGM